VVQRRKGIEQSVKFDRHTLSADRIPRHCAAIVTAQRKMIQRIPVGRSRAQPVVEQMLIAGPVFERMIEDRVRSPIGKEIGAQLPGYDRHGYQHQCQDQASQNT
jgi:hypothetical protein